MVGVASAPDEPAGRRARGGSNILRQVPILRELTSAFIDIALHRKGPDVLPASPFLFGLVLGAYSIVSLAALSITWSLGRALAAMLADTAIYLAFFGVVLASMRRGGRFWQTATAILGTETFLSCLALPLLLTRPAEPDGSAFEVLASSVLLGLLLWSVDIAGFVLSRALDRPYIVGVLIMIGYVVGSMFLGEFLFPTLD